MWHVLIKLYNEITISFLPVGHTKFFLDAGFGMLKRKFQLTNAVIGCDKSAAKNHVQLVGDQSGNVIAASHDWVTFLRTA